MGHHGDGHVVLRGAPQLAWRVCGVRGSGAAAGAIRRLVRERVRIQPSLHRVRASPAPRLPRSAGAPRAAYSARRAARARTRRGTPAPRASGAPQTTTGSMRRTTVSVISPRGALYHVPARGGVSGRVRAEGYGHERATRARVDRHALRELQAPRALAVPVPAARRRLGERRKRLDKVDLAVERHMQPLHTARVVVRAHVAHLAHEVRKHAVRVRLRMCGQRNAQVGEQLRCRRQKHLQRRSREHRAQAQLLRVRPKCRAKLWPSAVSLYGCQHTVPHHEDEAHTLARCAAHVCVAPERHFDARAVLHRHVQKPLVVAIARSEQRAACELHDGAAASHAARTKQCSGIRCSRVVVISFQLRPLDASMPLTMPMNAAQSMLLKLRRASSVRVWRFTRSRRPWRTRGLVGRAGHRGLRCPKRRGTGSPMRGEQSGQQQAKYHDTFARAEEGGRGGSEGKD
ncbi:hypothetical protein GGX14DRAFT_587502 [Mycena pura]|uniref:Uncharacterized protein n=1 Tax=Mycena pura TaxID=153505 RepID=A0AAD6UT15_9AGAR|nr:hypothetical protein GGX14DRAFT_587502 [Mycena pura]